MSVPTCPFCGGDSRITSRDDAYYWAYCTTCLSGGPIGKTEEQAIAKWELPVNSTLRDQFAMHALALFKAKNDWACPYESAAKEAYKLADAMLKERAK